MDYRSMYLQMKQTLLQAGDSYCQARKQRMESSSEDVSLWEDQLYAHYEIEKHYRNFKKVEEQLLKWAQNQIRAYPHRRVEKEILNRDFSYLPDRLLAIDTALRL